MKIKKRNGQIVDFDSKKITDAITKAGIATGEFDEQVAKKLTMKVLTLMDQLKLNSPFYIEDIQNTVERILIDSIYIKTAKAYIIYREQRSKVRNITEKYTSDLVDNYLEKLDWKVKENSNMSYSIQGLNNYISSDITTEYWLNKIYPVEVKNAHKNGDIHIHDLSLLAVYCVGWDLQDILLSGFCGVSGKVDSAPPKHFKSALGQIVNFFYTLQGEAAGAQALSNFDTLLAPFIRYDHLSFEKVYQALQEFVFNMNIPTRVGFQTPFTNITMDLTVPSTLKDQPIIIGGEYYDLTYGAFQHEIDMINKAFAEIMSKGDAKGRVFTFPIPTYNITEDFDWNNPNLEPLWKMTGKYGIPYFSNFINSDMSPDDARSMCCRLRLDNRELKTRGGGLFAANPLTGSIGVVTINLPRIAKHVENESQFIYHLTKQLAIAKSSLELKRKVLEDFTDKNLYPYVKFYLRNIKEQSGQYWINHFSTIGIIGMHEACLNLYNKGIETKTGQKFAIRVMDYIKSLLSKFQIETGNNYNLEATPGEGTGSRFAKIDEDHDYPYYTNSTHLPVNFSDDIFEVLELQDELQTKYTGGTVLHMFLGENITDTKIVKNLVRKVCENYKLPYFTLSPTFSICQNHGYQSGKIETCSDCGNENEVYSRVVGYLRPVKQWNDGKQKEFKDRKTFKI